MRWHNRQAASVGMEVRSQLIAQKLTSLGLSPLGTRSGKSGDQYGTPEGARRVAVGARELMLNYLLAEAQQIDGGRWSDNSRWSMWKNFSIKQLYERPDRDTFLQNAVKWVMDGPTMKEVRQRAREDAMAQTKPGPEASDYERNMWSPRGMAMGLHKSKPVQPAPAATPEAPPAQPAAPTPALPE